MYLFELVFLFLDKYLEVELLGHALVPFLVLRNLHTLFHSSCTNLVYESSFFSTSLSPFAVCVLFDVVILTGVRRYLIVVLVCISLMISNSILFTFEGWHKNVPYTPFEFFLFLNLPVMQEPPNRSWVWKVPRRRDRLPILVPMDFSRGSDGEESICNAGHLGSIPGLGRFLREGYGNSLRGWVGESRLENPMDRGARQATAHGVAQSRTRLGGSAQHMWSTLKANRRAITNRVNPLSSHKSLPKRASYTRRGP